MASTPDLSGIVNLIMQNPSLIEQISALANSKTESEAPTEVTNEDVPTVNDAPAEVSASSTSMPWVSCLPSTTMWHSMSASTIVYSCRRLPIY